MTKRSEDEYFIHLLINAHVEQLINIFDFQKIKKKVNKQRKKDVPWYEVLVNILISTDHIETGRKNTKRNRPLEKDDVDYADRHATKLFSEINNTLWMDEQDKTNTLSYTLGAILKKLELAEYLDREDEVKDILDRNQPVLIASQALKNHKLMDNITDDRKAQIQENYYQNILKFNDDLYHWVRPFLKSLELKVTGLGYYDLLPNNLKQNAYNKKADNIIEATRRKNNG